MPDTPLARYAGLGLPSKDGPPAEPVGIRLPTGAIRYGKPTCYYAHPTSMYDTGEEMHACAGLAKSFHVVNPNEPTHCEAYKVQGMAYFVQLVQHLEACVYSTFPSGEVGAGVAKEVQTFLDAGKPVFRLISIRHCLLKPVDEIREKILDVETTRKIREIFQGKSHEVLGAFTGF